MPNGTYTFLPFLRQGLGTQVTGSAANRPTIQVDLHLVGEPLAGGPAATAIVPRTVELYGPGDVTGIDPRQVVRTEPVAFTANFEPNYLAAVDFYDEDFPWRYTPAAPSGHRLTPWISLVVLADGEFTPNPPDGARTLPSIMVHDCATLPRSDQLWAWAHVQVNRQLPGTGVVSGDANQISARVADVLSENADLACSRLVCPRHLAPDTAYHAFVVPSFEAGRLAGLFPNPPAASVGAPSWTSGQVDRELPVYFRWSFRTGVVGDFEYLVRLLKPRPADPRVGRRPVDVLDPGDGLHPIDDADLGGVVQLGGALQVPDEALDQDARDERLLYEAWAGGPPGTHPFQSDLAALVNLGADYPTAAAPAPGDPGGGDDPVITPPLYGRWHAPVVRVLEAGSRWPDQLNLDPRHRAAAAFGTGVVQRDQEDLMAAAWAQLGDVLAANALIRRFRLARQVSTTWHRRTFQGLARRSPGRALQLAGGSLGRVMMDSRTVRGWVNISSLPDAAVEGPLRRILRPNGRLGRRGRPHPRRAPGTLVAELTGQLATGKLSAAPARPQPALTTVEAATDAAARGRRPVGPEGRRFLDRVRDFDRRLEPAPKPVGDTSTPVVDGLRQGALQLSTPDEPVPLRQGGPDNDVSIRFKQALRDLHQTQVAITDSAPEPPPFHVEVEQLAGAAIDGLTPSATFPRRLRHLVGLPDRLIDGMVPRPDGDIDEIMAYPVFDRPMYEPLVGLGDELFLPNLQLIAENSITLLEANQPFIESYLVGLNHEMARELLWREYPTDQRGSPFRQFWDVREPLALRGDTPAHREELRDIPPLHEWGAGTDLGDHDHRRPPGDAHRALVLVIRGELLKRYPTAVIYAHRAAWQRRADGSIDRTQPRRLVDIPPAQETNPPATVVRLPQFSASVKPDITFLGFDLDAGAVKGGVPGPGTPDPDPGWFFVIKERPGDVRFGLDVDSDLSATQLRLWNDLAWEHLTPVTPGFAEITQTITLAAATFPPGDQQQQRAEDVQVRWATDSHAADVAYVLFQVPALVAVHGSELLRSRP